MSDISDEEQERIVALRSRVSPLLTAAYDTDYNLLRFIRACGGDIEQAVPSLRHHLIMRRALHLDTIAQDLPDPCRINDECTPISILGGCGRPDENKIVIFEFPGKVDVHGLMKSIQPTPFMQQRFKVMEKLLGMINEEERRTNKISGLVWVYDMEGLEFDPSLLTILTGPFKNMWTLLGSMYPEMIHKFLVINVPTFMNVLWSAFSPFIPHHTKDKIVITGENWKEVLLEHIDADTLPVKWGGKFVDADGDGGCSQLIRIPINPIPEELYWKPRCDEPQMKDLTDLLVPAGKYRLLSYEVFEANTIISLYNQCNDEYGLAIYFTDNPKEDNLSNMENVYGELSQPGMDTCDRLRYTCDRPGIYHIKYGNEIAWIYSVTVKYHLSFLNAEGIQVHDAAMSLNFD